MQNVTEQGKHKLKTTTLQCIVIPRHHAWLLLSKLIKSSMY